MSTSETYVVALVVLPNAIDGRAIALTFDSRNEEGPTAVEDVVTRALHARAEQDLQGRQLLVLRNDPGTRNILNWKRFEEDERILAVVAVTHALQYVFPSAASIGTSQSSGTPITHSQLAALQVQAAYVFAVAEELLDGSDVQTDDDDLLETAERLVTTCKEILIAWGDPARNQARREGTEYEPGTPQGVGTRFQTEIGKTLALDKKDWKENQRRKGWRVVDDDETDAKGSTLPLGNSGASGSQKPRATSGGGLRRLYNVHVSCEYPSITSPRVREVPAEQQFTRTQLEVIGEVLVVRISLVSNASELQITVTTGISGF